MAAALAAPPSPSAGRCSLDGELRAALDADSHLYSLFLDGALVDVHLVASDGAVVGAHRVVLAAASRFFRALFTGHWQQAAQQGGGPQQVALSGVDGESLQLLLHAIYSRRLPLTAEGAAEDAAMLLGAANYLEVLPVKAAVCEFLRAKLTLQTVADTLALAAANDCLELLEDASRFFEGHFCQLLKSEEAASSLAVLPPDLLRQLLSSDGLNLGSELDVARAALLWAAADPQGRGLLLAELLPAARMPPKVLLEEAARCGLLASAGDGCAQLLLRPLSPPPAALALHGGPHQQWAGAQQQEQQLPMAPPTPPQPGLERSELADAFQVACQQLHSAGWAAAGAADLGAEAALTVFRPRLSSPTGLIMAGGLDDGWRSLRTVELYDAHQDSWTPGPQMPAPLGFAAAAMVGGHTLVVEGTAHSPHVFGFDRQHKRWSQCTSLRTPRVNMAVAALEGQLYVLGGRAGLGKGAAVLQDVEVFDPVTNTWQAAPPMAAPRTSHAAVALGGRLFAVGGQDSRSTHATCEVFDPAAGRWATLGARLQVPRKYLGLTAAAGRLIAVGGMTGARMRLPSAEALDPREGRWVPLPPMSAARSSCGAAELHGSVFVVGGNVGLDIHENYAGVEAWVPAAGRWRRCAPISHGRSGISLSAT
ncbi:hypothetical protein ABPG75_001775 [Micractinium tetrahymenae]